MRIEDAKLIDLAQYFSYEQIRNTLNSMLLHREKILYGTPLSFLNVEDTTGNDKRVVIGVVTFQRISNNVLYGDICFVKEDCYEAFKLDKLEILPTFISDTMNGIWIFDIAIKRL